MRGLKSRRQNLYGSCHVITSKWAITFYTSMSDDNLDLPPSAWCSHRSCAKTKPILSSPFPLSLVFQWRSWNNSSLKPWRFSISIWIWLYNSAKPYPTALLNFESTSLDSRQLFYYFASFSFIFNLWPTPSPQPPDIPRNWTNHQWVQTNQTPSPDSY